MVFPRLAYMASNRRSRSLSSLSLTHTISQEEPPTVSLAYIRNYLYSNQYKAPKETLFSFFPELKSEDQATRTKVRKSQSKICFFFYQYHHHGHSKYVPFLLFMQRSRSNIIVVVVQLRISSKTIYLFCDQQFGDFFYKQSVVVILSEST